MVIRNQLLSLYGNRQGQQRLLEHPQYTFRYRFGRGYNLNAVLLIKYPVVCGFPHSYQGRGRIQYRKNFRVDIPVSRPGDKERRIGDIQQLLGHNEKAENAYRQALEIYESLPESNPSMMDYISTQLRRVTAQNGRRRDTLP